MVYILGNYFVDMIKELPGKYIIKNPKPIAHLRKTCRNFKRKLKRPTKLCTIENSLTSGISVELKFNEGATKRVSKYIKQYASCPKECSKNLSNGFAGKLGQSNQPHTREVRKHLLFN